jgi:hypothetical protein
MALLSDGLAVVTSLFPPLPSSSPQESGYDVIHTPTFFDACVTTVNLAWRHLQTKLYLIPRCLV